MSTPGWNFSTLVFLGRQFFLTASVLLAAGAVVVTGAFLSMLSFLVASTAGLLAGAAGAVTALGLVLAGA